MSCTSPAKSTTSSSSRSSNKNKRRAEEAMESLLEVSEPMSPSATEPAEEEHGSLSAGELEDEVPRLRQHRLYSSFHHHGDTSINSSFKRLHVESPVSLLDAAACRSSRRNAEMPLSTVSFNLGHNSTVMAPGNVTFSKPTYHPNASFSKPANLANSGFSKPNNPANQSFSRPANRANVTFSGPMNAVNSSFSRPRSAVNVSFRVPENPVNTSSYVGRTVAGDFDTKSDIISGGGVGRTSRVVRHSYPRRQYNDPGLFAEDDQLAELRHRELEHSQTFSVPDTSRILDTSQYTAGPTAAGSTAGVTSILGRSSSSSDASSFSELESNIYQSFTREASLRNAAMRNTYVKPRGRSHRARRAQQQQQHHHQQQQQQQQRAQPVYQHMTQQHSEQQHMPQQHRVHRSSRGTGASGHYDLNTSSVTEPPPASTLDDSFNSDVISVVSARSSRSAVTSSSSRKHHYIQRSAASGDGQDQGRPTTTAAGKHRSTSGYAGQIKMSAYVNYGLLTVHMAQGKKLISNINEQCSSFVQISLEPDEDNRTQCRTSMVGDSNCPVYDEKFSFELMEEDYRKRLYVCVYNIDFDSGSKELLGSMSISVKRILAQPEGNKIKGWFYLLPEARGKKHCLTVREPKEPHLPPSDHPATSSSSSHHQQQQQARQRGPLPPLPPPPPSALPPLPPMNAALRPEQAMVWMDSHVIHISNSRLGFGFVVTGSSPVQVSQVYPDCPAARAGLKSQDYITHINGLNVSKSSAESVAKMIGGITCSTLVVEIQRPRSMASVNMSLVTSKPGDVIKHKPELEPAPLLVTGKTKSKKSSIFPFKLPSLSRKESKSSKLNKTVLNATSSHAKANQSLYSKLNKSLNITRKERKADKSRLNFSALNISVISKRASRTSKCKSTSAINQTMSGTVSVSSDLSAATSATTTTDSTASISIVRDIIADTTRAADTTLEEPDHYDCGGAGDGADGSDFGDCHTADGVSVVEPPEVSVADVLTNISINTTSSKASSVRRLKKRFSLKKKKNKGHMTVLAEL